MPVRPAHRHAAPLRRARLPFEARRARGGVHPLPRGRRLARAARAGRPLPARDEPPVQDAAARAEAGHRAATARPCGAGEGEGEEKGEAVDAEKRSVHDGDEEKGGLRPKPSGADSHHKLSKSHLNQHNVLTGKPAPPLEWIGLHRERLPNLTHQIVIVALLELAGEVEDAYSRILGSS